jgi:hypothetical protein
MQTATRPRIIIRKGKDIQRVIDRYYITQGDFCKMVAAIKELYGAVEAEMIAERTRPGRERRFAAGFPHGGRYGPPYGYRWRPKDPDAKTYSGYEIDPDRAEIVKEIFRRFANDEHTTARGLAIELKRRGVPTAGGGDWSGPQILGILRNPIYCGRGVRKRWHTKMEEKIDEATGRKNDYRITRDTLRYPDQADPEHTTYAVANDMAPPIVDQELWDAAQQAVKRNRKFGGKLKRVNSPHKEEATLLHGGFVFCARCGGMMTRHWRCDYEELKPTYRCTKYASTPNHPCKVHGINAQAVDRIVLQALAKALTDPEQLVALADAADQQAVEAEADVERAGAALAVYRELDARREQERNGYLDAIAALSSIPGDTNRDTIADLRAKLAQLDKDQVKADAERKQMIPEHERALRRQRVLDRISHFTNEPYIFDMETGEVRIEGEASGERVLYQSLDFSAVAELLGMSEAELKATGIPLQVGKLYEDPETNPGGEWVVDVDREHVAYMLLSKAPHARVRQLLRDLNVRVLVKPPRTKEERAIHGLTPVKERVTIKFLADSNAAVQVCLSDKKPHDLSSRSRW